MDNERIADHLRQIEYEYQNKRDKFRSKTFLEAANSVQNYPEKITSGTQAKKNIRGIGASVEEVIDQFLKTGTSDRLKSLSPEDKKETISLLTKVYGVGAVAANKFYENGVRSLEDLAKQDLTTSQRLGLEYYYDLQVRIPRSEIDAIRDLLEGLFSLVDEDLEWEIVGSYRRGSETSGDIDILIKKKDGVELSNIVEVLEPNDDFDFLKGILAQGQSKFMGIVQLEPNLPARRLDILLVSSESWGTALVYFTGSQKFNIYLRQLALDQELTLNEYRLKDTSTGEEFYSESEEGVFGILNIDYVSPEDRNY